MDLSRFTDLLERAFLEFRIRQTRHRLSVSLNSFANYLDYSPPIVNQWLNGSRLPSQGNVERIIPKLVELLDTEVYDVLGLPRPDPDLQRLSQVWPRISKEHRQALAEQAEKYAAESESNLTPYQSPLPMGEPIEHGSENDRSTIPVATTSLVGDNGSSDSVEGSIPAETSSSASVSSASRIDDGPGAL
jgi:transcriptional regulator with XRE-family HTH domain